MQPKLPKLNMKRAIAAVMAVLWVLMLCVPCAAAETEGSCGSGVTWKYADGTLTVTGNGAMSSYSAKSPAPWSAFRDELRIVLISSGVSAVGNYAFYNYPALTSVTLQNSVTSIGAFAFADCSNLKMINLGGAVKSIGANAFDTCTALQSVRLPETLTEIGDEAFYRCDALRSVTVPASVTSMGNMLFARCNGLMNAEILASVDKLPYWTFYGCDSLARVTLSANIRSLGSKAFFSCNNLTDVYYMGNTTDGDNILSALYEMLPTFNRSFFRYTFSNVGKTESMSGYIDQNKLVSESVTLHDSSNANISTTVTTTTEVDMTGEIPVLGDKQSSVKIDAVIESAEGWSELVEQIGEGIEMAKKTTDQEVKVSVSLNTETENTISKDTLAAVAGEDVKLTVEMSDGSAYRIDCSRLEEEKLKEDYQLTYSLKANPDPTDAQRDVFGNATNYFLNFPSDTAMDYSPRIYLGFVNARRCAVLYQQINGGKIERVQSAIIDKSGYATFYLGQTLSNVQYYIALDVKPEEYEKAIIPDEIAVDDDTIEQYEPIEYVVTGERIFMGMNFGQFSYVMFGVIFGLFAVIGTVMAIFYRKKRLEMMYKMKMEGMK